MKEVRKIYRLLKIKSKKIADYWVNTVFAILITLVMAGTMGYLLFNKNDFTSDDAGWDTVMTIIIAAMLIFSLAMLYVLFRKRIKKDWED